MTPTASKILTYTLKPLSWLYGTVMSVRARLFEEGAIKRAQFDVPVISVGNLTVGGTGKTPHAEYLVANLMGSYTIGVLSRGYKRKTRGYVLANSHSTPESIGDEPYQIYRKFSKRISVAVCEKRSEGIKMLLRDRPEVNLIILDDAFQHLWVRPKISVLLMDYYHPIYTDQPLPLGRLREHQSAAARADMVVVTKCPSGLKPIDQLIVRKHLELMPYQKLFFSEIVYDEIEPVFTEDSPYSASLGSLTRNDSVLLLTGIANPRSFIRHFAQYPCRTVISHFPDHHAFTRKDLTEIERTFKKMKGVRKLIVTTEKDAVRLANNPYFPADLKPYVFFLPIRVQTIPGEDGDFIERIKAAIHSDSL